MTIPADNVMRLRRYLLHAAVILLLVGLAACAPKKVRPEKPEAEPPAKRPPAGATIPPTQRPYKINGKTYYPIPSAEGFTETGIASWYGSDFHGKKTSNGEKYDMYAMTAAHKTLPMNTFLLVRNNENGREITVRVNDRGPFMKNRIVDLSNTAAREIGMLGKGTAPVTITALGEAVPYQSGSRTLERFLPHGDFNRGDFYVQIGSFAEQANAERLRQKMIDQGRKTVLQTAQIEGITLYRVQIHGGDTMTAAKQLEQSLSAEGYPDAFVVAR